MLHKFGVLALSVILSGVCYAGPNREIRVQSSLGGPITSITEAEFQRRYGVEYLSRLRIDPGVRNYVSEHYETAPNAGKASPQELAEAQAILRGDSSHWSIVLEGRPVLETLLYDTIYEGKLSPVYIAKVNDAVGLGLFAEKPIAQGEVIGEYTGLIVGLPIYDLKRAVYLMSYTSATAIDALKQGNETRYINHSSKHANARPRRAIVNGMPHILIIAVKPIAAGKQILFDYGRGYWQGQGGPPEDLEP